jgi:uncharacterized protein (TIGR00730 family)
VGNSYLKAFEDIDFLNRDELRAVRLQTELLKPELIMEDELILSTVCVFGSARTLDPTEAQAKLQRAEDALTRDTDSAAAQERVRLAQIAVEHSVDYARARQFAALMSQFGQKTGALEFVICTGGGPGIMEAANRGAADVNAKSLGLNITLPHEQKPNRYVTPELNFLFQYFSIRKMHFLLRARALCAFPGGFGTLDELFETLTLIQTHKTERIPVILFNRPYWDGLINWQVLVDRGMIAREDLNLVVYAEDPKTAVELIVDFHGRRTNSR